ncbi:MULTISPECIES: tetratricopeptide repeat protein [Streptomyces violaceusniger group]|uniref:tetratricopeptide repeat protein n=1 Tax=Streptomyces violaceusniger group TaxID=2839105 RepID=UPI0027DFBCB2|nr:tetratricopeptide repeat protein [Streptomyces cangkringensis]
MGKYTEAELLLRNVRAMQIRIFGDRDPDTLDSSHGLQLVLANLGMREDALALLKSVAAGRKAVGLERHTH